jgi:hypothetical protein
MTTYSLPDLSGRNPAYLQVNLLFHIYDNNIKLTFENSPVFASSIRIVLTDGSSAELIRDQHWKVDPTDIDQTAMSKAYLEDADFDEVLVRSITIISPSVVGKRVAVNVQQFYDTIPGRFFDDGAPLELTPALIKSMISGLADTRQQLAKVRSPVTPSDTAPTLLPFDINAERAGNKIVNEKITINTVGGGKIIRLTQGAFFADDLVVTKNGVPLTKATDYLPVMVSPLTKQTVKKGGIYQYLLILTPLVGDLEIDYHAVGGEVQQDDISALYDLSVSIKNFLNDQIFITADSIPETPAFRAHQARLTILENQMRSMLSGTPTYGDATSYDKVRRPISAPDSKFHWYTIANLYKVAGSTDVVTADQFKGRVFFPGAKVALSFTVDVNLNQTRNPVTISSSNLVFDPLYVPFVESSANAPVYPMLRAVWNKTSEGLSGMSLQVGLPLLSLSETMYVESTSTLESCWLLDKTGQVITGNEAVTPSAPRDSGFTLPDLTAIWSDTGSASLSRVHVPNYRNGYLMYSGSTIGLDSLVSAGVDKPAVPATSTKNLFNIVLPTYFPIDQMTQVLVMMSSPDTSVIYDLEITLSPMNLFSRFGKVTFTDSTGKRMTMSATLTQDSSGAVSVSLNASDTPGSPVDVVRYIRARV